MVVWTVLSKLFVCVVCGLWISWWCVRIAIDLALTGDGYFRMIRGLRWRCGNAVYCFYIQVLGYYDWRMEYIGDAGMRCCFYIQVLGYYDWRMEYIEDSGMQYCFYIQALCNIMMDLLLLAYGIFWIVSDQVVWWMTGAT